jgi:hypothetical protein
VGREASRARAWPTAWHACASREAFFESSDVLSRAPAAERRHARHRRLEDLSRMKPTALFVNTSRAELVSRRTRWCRAEPRPPGMAAVDVFESEPILQGHPLLRLENAVCTPHIGYVEQDSYELYFGAAFDNVINFINQEADQHRQPRGAAGDPLRRPAWHGGVAAGLIVATASRSCRRCEEPAGPAGLRAVRGRHALAVGWWRVPLVQVVLGLGAVSMALAAWRLQVNPARSGSAPTC